MVQDWKSPLSPEAPRASAWGLPKSSPRGAGRFTCWAGMGKRARAPPGRCRMPTSHQADVADYDSLAAAFKLSERFDFVFADAGIMERASFYEKVQTLPLTKPEFPTIDVGFKGPERGYGGECKLARGTVRVSVHTHLRGAKAAIVNFMRSIAFPFHHFDGIRTYTICPGGIKTNPMMPKEQAAFPESMWTPMAKVTDTVEMLINGVTVEHSWGKRVEMEANYGLTMEINNDKHYFRNAGRALRRTHEALAGSTWLLVDTYSVGTKKCCMYRLSARFFEFVLDSQESLCRKRTLLVRSLNPMKRLEMLGRRSLNGFSTVISLPAEFPLRSNNNMIEDET
ncbi:hypothetical protein DL770_004800 [Monosporascus sp. CRB-9-2]|nr:hypothetical protein DL770_004800 [Monosporascus sp. CRB-9-2]